jgi:hypothetical protein
MSKSLKKARLKILFDSKTVHEVQNLQYSNKMNGNFIHNYKITMFSGLFFEEVFPLNKLNLLNYTKNV